LHIPASRGGLTSKNEILIDVTIRHAHTEAPILPKGKSQQMEKGKLLNKYSCAAGGAASSLVLCFYFLRIFPPSTDCLHLFFPSAHQPRY